MALYDHTSICTYILALHHMLNIHHYVVVKFLLLRGARKRGAVSYGGYNFIAFFAAL